MSQHVRVEMSGLTLFKKNTHRQELKQSALYQMVITVLYVQCSCYNLLTLITNVT